jgi:hypothetical protein
VRSIPITSETWRPTFRLIPSRFPPVLAFDRVADPADLDAVFYVEGLTNDRLREELGELHLVDPEDRVAGDGSTPIMAAFTHLNPNGSRFSDGSYGVYYAARSEETALRETIHHRECFMRESNEPAMDLDMRMYYSDLNGDLHDIRKHRKSNTEWYDPDDYTASQLVGQKLKAGGSFGILYQSVRHDGGECVAVLRPPVLSPCIQGPHYTYVWDGKEIVDVYEKRSISISL